MWHVSGLMRVRLMEVCDSQFEHDKLSMCIEVNNHVF
jgi:hypothetical protein